MPQGWQCHCWVSWAPHSISVSISSLAAQYQVEKTQNWVDDQAREGKLFTSTNCWFRMFAESGDVLWVIHKEKKRICKKYY